MCASPRMMCSEMSPSGVCRATVQRTVQYCAKNPQANMQYYDSDNPVSTPDLELLSTSETSQTQTPLVPRDGIQLMEPKHVYRHYAHTHSQLTTPTEGHVDNHRRTASLRVRQRPKINYASRQRPVVHGQSISKFSSYAYASSPL